VDRTKDNRAVIKLYFALCSFICVYYRIRFFLRPSYVVVRNVTTAKFMQNIHFTSSVIFIRVILFCKFALICLIFGYIVSMRYGICCEIKLRVVSSAVAPRRRLLYQQICAGDFRFDGRAVMDSRGALRGVHTYTVPAMSCLLTVQLWRHATVSSSSSSNSSGGGKDADFWRRSFSTIPLLPPTPPPTPTSKHLLHDVVIVPCCAANVTSFSCRFTSALTANSDVSRENCEP